MKGLDLGVSEFVQVPCDAMEGPPPRVFGEDEPSFESMALNDSVIERTSNYFVIYICERELSTSSDRRNEWKSTTPICTYSNNFYSRIFSRYTKKYTFVTFLLKRSQMYNSTSLWCSSLIEEI